MGSVHDCREYPLYVARGAFGQRHLRRHRSPREGDEVSVACNGFCYSHPCGERCAKARHNGSCECAGHISVHATTRRPSGISDSAWAEVEAALAQSREECEALKAQLGRAVELVKKGPYPHVFLCAHATIGGDEPACGKCWPCRRD